MRKTPIRTYRVITVYLLIILDISDWKNNGFRGLSMILASFEFDQAQKRIKDMYLLIYVFYVADKKEIIINLLASGQ